MQKIKDLRQATDKMAEEIKSGICLFRMRNFSQSWHIVNYINLQITGFKIRPDFSMDVNFRDTIKAKMLPSTD